MKNTSHKHLVDIAERFAALNIKNVIISPGSRCAPLIFAFNRNKKFKCYTIVDERSAAFYAIGMAQQSEMPTVLICTSGTALLNYAPAVAEAFYQKVPLIILSADRPSRLINVNAGQTLNQKNVFQNYCICSYHLTGQFDNEAERKNEIEKVIEVAKQSFTVSTGPIHINVELDEPLYDFQDYAHTNYEPLSIKQEKDKYGSNTKSENSKVEKLKFFHQSWEKAQKILIVVGQFNHPSQMLINWIEQLCHREDVVVFSETTSNLVHKNIFKQYDRIAFSIHSNQEHLLHADMILTLGEAIVSKKIKQLLSKVKATKIHIGRSNQTPKPFGKETVFINCPIEETLNELQLKVQLNSSFKKEIAQLNEKLNTKHKRFLNEIKWSDLQIMQFIYSNLPRNCVLQLGNSTPVRYSNLFEIDHDKNIQVFSNRGVSGIDGQTSTAAGAALETDRLTICLTGDLAFFYDSNAFWNAHVPNNFKVVMINNQGGGIFRFVKGPSETEELENFFEARHSTSAKYIAKCFKLNYFTAENLNDLKNHWASFLADKSCAIFELNTDGVYSGKVLNEYFKRLKS